MSESPAAHPILQRQLRRTGLQIDRAPERHSLWGRLLEGISLTYREHQQDLYLLERAQDLSSRELEAQARTLQLNEERLTSLLSLTSDWVWEIDSRGHLSYLSEGVETHLGVSATALLGTRFTHMDGADASPQDKQQLRRCLAEGTPFKDLTFGLKGAAGSVRHVRLSGRPLHGPDGAFQGFRGVGSDATEATLAARRAEHLARSDGLTGLANRHQLMDTLPRAVARAQRSGKRLALAFFDLDGFKLVNDLLGHAAGDEMLRITAQRLAQGARQGDLVARLGGDEFVVLFEPAPEQEQLAQLGARLIAEVCQPVLLEGRQARVGCSVGISVFPQDASDATEMLRHADAAMYDAKARNSDQVAFYGGELAVRVADLFALEADLCEAVLPGATQLVLHYQPKLRLTDGALAGVEALVRWQHPTRGLLNPADFVPLAEQRGLVVALGRWVIEAACAQMGAWRSEGLQVMRCAINISAQHFASDQLAVEVRTALERHGLDPQCLEMEVTESAVMANPARAEAVMEMLTDLGVGIAIDDFGTGHSSLAYLKRFPVRVLKIDSSFVRGLPGDINDAAIAKAVVSMAKSLGMQTVAEGVETPEQLAFLRDVGCDEAQGFLLSRPKPAHELRPQCLGAVWASVCPPRHLETTG